MGIAHLTQEDALRAEQERKEEIQELNKALISIDESIDKATV